MYVLWLLLFPTSLAAGTCFGEVVQLSSVQFS